jgi:hypothetical protein
MANIEGPESGHLPVALIKALRRKFGTSGEKAVRLLEQQARAQYRPALDLLRERMSFTDALQQATLTNLLENDGLDALIDSYAEGPNPSKARNQPETADTWIDPNTVQAKAVRAMDEIVRSIAATVAPYEAPRLSANKNYNANLELSSLSDEELEQAYNEAVQRAALQMIDPDLFPMESTTITGSLGAEVPEEDEQLVGVTGGK